MSRTKEERREINRENASKSTGPRSDEGKTHSRYNALKHGLRAASICLPNEDPAAVEARLRDWDEYYRPDSPAAVHLVNQCVQATLLSERCQRYHAATIARQVRQSADQWWSQREDEVERLVLLLKDDPDSAVRLLQRSAHGCRWLIERWERLATLLGDTGVWCTTDRDEAIRLQGFRPDTDQLKHCPNAFLTSLYNLLCYPGPLEQYILWLFHADRMPDTLQGVYSAERLPEPARCREMLHDMIKDQLAPLRENEARLTAQIDAPDLAQAADRALVLEDQGEAQLFLRYHTESRTAFHKSYALLVRTLDRAEAAPSAAAEGDTGGLSTSATLAPPEPGALVGKPPVPPDAVDASSTSTDAPSPSTEDAPAAGDTGGLSTSVPLGPPQPGSLVGEPPVPPDAVEESPNEAIATPAAESPATDVPPPSTEDVPATDGLPTTVPLGRSQSRSLLGKPVPSDAADDAPVLSFPAPCPPVEYAAEESPNEANASPAPDPVILDRLPIPSGPGDAPDANAEVAPLLHAVPAPQADHPRAGPLAGRVRDRAKRSRNAARPAESAKPVSPNEANEARRAEVLRKLAVLEEARIDQPNETFEDLARGIKVSMACVAASEGNGAGSVEEVMQAAS